MLSTALAICIGSVDNASLALMSTFDLEWRPRLDFTNFKTDPAMAFQILGPQRVSWTDVHTWTWAGAIAGLGQQAEKILNNRRQKWDVKMPQTGRVIFHDFLKWFMLEKQKKDYSFPILDKSPAGSTELFATIEILIDFGFNLALTIELGPSLGTLIGRVTRIPSVPGQEIPYLETPVGSREMRRRTHSAIVFVPCEDPRAEDALAEDWDVELQETTGQLPSHDLIQLGPVEC